MRKHAIFSAVLVVMTIAGSRLAVAEEPLEKLIAKAEAGGDKQAELYVDVARRYAEQANQHLAAGETDKAKDDLKNIVSYAEKARATVGRSDGRIKQTELKMHKLHRRLEEMVRATDVDDRPPVAAAADHVQELRSQLLDLLFRKDK